MENQRGFVALISIIIISAMLLVLVVTLETASFFQRFDALDAENKRVSLGLAEACVSAAQLLIAQGTPSNSELPKVTVDSSDAQKTCRICKTTAAGAIATRAVYNGAYSNLSVTINTTPGSYAVTAWTETATGDAACSTFP